MKGVFRNCVLGVVLLMAVSAVSLYMGQFGQAEGVSAGQGILIRGIRKIFSEAGKGRRKGKGREKGHCGFGCWTWRDTLQMEMTGEQIFRLTSMPGQVSIILY